MPASSFSFEISHAERKTCNPHLRFGFAHNSASSPCQKLPISPLGRIASIRSPVNSLTTAIALSRMTTSATFHGSMPAQWSSLRKWVSSPFTTYLMISS